MVLITATLCAASAAAQEDETSAPDSAEILPPFAGFDRPQPSSSEATVAAPAESVTAPDDGAGEAAVEAPADAESLPAVDETSLEEEGEPAPTLPADARIAYGILGAVLGALAVGACGFGIAIASASVDHPDRSIDDMLLIGLMGTGVGFPIGASLGIILAGEATHSGGEPAGPIVGSLLGAGVGVLLGATLAATTQDLGTSIAIGGTTGGVLSLLGAVVGYQLTAHPRAQAEATAWAPIIAPSATGLTLGAAGVF